MRRELNARGANVWVDHTRLRPGTPSWDEAIREGIAASDKVIYAASPNARRSLWVQGELDVAQNMRKPIVCFWLAGEEGRWAESAPLNMTKAQYIDARGKLFDTAIVRLAVACGLPAPAPGQGGDGATKPSVHPGRPPAHRGPANEEYTSVEEEDDDSDWGRGPAILRVARVLGCSLLMVTYWLLIGYATLQLFYLPILRISRAPLPIYWLSGSGVKVELVKTVALIASLAADWFLVGAILSHTFHIGSFPLPYDASVLAAIATAIWLGVCALYGVLRWREWPYTNVFNCRKVCLVTFVTMLEILATQIPLFGPAFLYFPIFATMVSVGVYLYLLISLGGTSFDEWGRGHNAFADRLNEAQKARERRGNVFFESREARKRRARQARVSVGGK